MAKDICDCLGLENVCEAVVGLDEDEKAAIRISDGSYKGVTQLHSKVTASEPGLYLLNLYNGKQDIYLRHKQRGRPHCRDVSRWQTGHEE